MKKKTNKEIKLLTLSKEEKPCDYDAWDIDIFYTQKCERPRLLSREIIENGELRLVMRSVYGYNKSVIPSALGLAQG